jgi:two-component system, chemotaxis family, response regulator Rcp1
MADQESKAPKEQEANNLVTILFSQKGARKVKSPLIFLVEDNPGDVDLMVQAFRESGFDYHLRVAKNGVEALQYLHRKGPYANAILPDLIILDLNLPRKDGRAVLAELKQDSVLRRIPIIILSMSTAQEDIMMSYELNANCFINKPVDLDQFITVVKTIKDFWLGVVSLPQAWGGAAH